MNIIEPLFERQFIFDSYANRLGKGTHAALDRCTHFTRRHRYAIHLDVCQFFPSVDHALLLSILSRTLADPQTMRLIEKILANSTSSAGDETAAVYFSGDDLFAALRPRGLPIGNLTSQHWANVYLNELDQFAKRTLHCRAYMRYVDDILLFADEKHLLHLWRQRIAAFLEKLRLTLHENSAQPQKTSTGISFLGFIIFPDHRRLKRANGFAFQRRLRAMLARYRSGQLALADLDRRVQSWIHHASHADTWGLRASILSKQLGRAPVASPRSPQPAWRAAEP